MLDQLCALGAGHHQRRRDLGAIGSRNNTAARVILAAGKRRIQFAHHGCRAWAVSPHHDAVRIKKIGHRRAFPQEFRVRDHIEVAAGLRGHGDHSPNPLAGVDRHGAFFYDNDVAMQRLRDLARHRLHEGEIGSAVFRGRSADGDEYDGRFLQRIVQGAAKTQSLPAMPMQQFGQVILENGDFAGDQGSQLLLIVVDANHLVADFRQASGRY